MVRVSLTDSVPENAIEVFGGYLPHEHSPELLIVGEGSLPSAFAAGAAHRWTLPANRLGSSLATC